MLRRASSHGTEASMTLEQLRDALGLDTSGGAETAEGRDEHSSAFPDVPEGENTYWEWLSPGTA